MSKGKYFGDFGSWNDMVSGFGYNAGHGDGNTLPASFPTDAEVVIACYENESYSGSATVVYTRDGKLFEMSSSHCSCNGLEWDAGTEISWEYIKNRFENGNFYGLNAEGVDALQKTAVEHLLGADLLKAVNDPQPGAEPQQDFSLLDPLEPATQGKTT
jgi:hypothetical protein